MDIELRGAAVPGSPLVSSVYDTSQISVATIPDGTVGRPVQFESESTQRGLESGQAVWVDLDMMCLNEVKGSL